MSNKTISQAGVNLIKSFEGVSLKSYKDIAGVLTVGYGHTGSDVKQTMTITPAQAEALLRKDLERFVDGVNKLVDVEINQNQFDALVSFSFNLGLGSLQMSHLLDLVNKKDFAGASQEFVKWNKARVKGVLQPVAGLTRRRQAESDLFMKAVPVPPVVPHVYKVQAGDDLTHIAKSFKTTVDEIVKLNKLQNENNIKVGQLLRVR
jgi:lysozyme